MRFIPVWVAMSLFVACSDDTSGSEAGDGFPACTPEWHTVADRLSAPAESFDGRCVSGTFADLGLNEDPECEPDSFVVEYYRKKHLFAMANSNGYDDYRLELLDPTYDAGDLSGPGYRRFDEEGRMIMLAEHRREAGSEVPLRAFYWRYDEEGREVDARFDRLEDGVMIDPGFPAYFDYRAVPWQLKDDSDGRWDGCMHTIHRTDAEPVTFPAAADIKNGGECETRVYHYRADGQETFSGIYAGADKQWLRHKISAYTPDGLIAREEYYDLEHDPSGEAFQSLVLYHYDSERRPAFTEKFGPSKGKEKDVLQEVIVYNWLSASVVLEVRRGLSEAGDPTYVDQTLREYNEDGRIVREDSLYDEEGRPTKRYTQSFDSAQRLLGQAYFDSRVDENGERRFLNIPHTLRVWEYDEDGRLVRHTEITNDPAGLAEPDNPSGPHEAFERTMRYTEGGLPTETRRSDLLRKEDTRTVYRFYCE